MHTAILYIAERCNQACVFCLEEDRSWSEFVDPSTEQVYGVLERLRERGAVHITFMGGETFFRKDLPMIISRAKSLGYTRVGVTTNGTVLSKPGFIDRLVAAGLDFIELSIHGHSPELANGISRNKVTFDRQAKAMAEIDATGSLFTIVNVVVCRENYEHLVEISRYVVESLSNVPMRFKFKFESLQGWALARVDEGQSRALGYEEVDFVGLGDTLDELGADFWFYNVPLCHLGAHADHAHELGVLAIDEQYFDMDHRGPNQYYDSGHQLEGRVWPTQTCGSCSVGMLCPGLEESHRLARGTGALSARSDNPRELLRAGMRARGVEQPDEATLDARLAVLDARERPTTFVRNRPDGGLRFIHAEESAPLDLMVDPDEGRPAFVSTGRFALHYRLRSDADREPSPRMQALLESAAKALHRADESGLDLEAARAAIVTAVSGETGWVCDLSTVVARPERKRSSLPIIQPGITG
ncbi:radical SAM protein [Pseudenhygromyxa sp. WMMC2535]|uniref:radical SAM protein n=1 Tax=Pseudenhygromyxa sp. WMMC2535 TaxID=2712867 RepID=UPI001557202E|nr:radical SAM protein [Pseudenhygromyxa sp. WMMC2535]NVB37921.1 radical SAM protein [Pseudenhygromyxa sp. WMMC2535]